MKTLVVVISHPQAEPIFQMNWPWLQRCGCDIAAVNHSGAPFFALDPHPRFNLSIGGPPNTTPNKWVDRFIDILQWCVSAPMSDPYDRYILTEADSIFLRPPPVLEGMWATLAGYDSAGFLAKRFFHTPWCFDRQAAMDFLRRARIMLGFGTALNEQGYIDRFIGLLTHLYEVPVGDLSSHCQAYTRNTLVEPAHVDECREWIKAGCWFVHGIKSPEVLRAVTEGL